MSVVECSICTVHMYITKCYAYQIFKRTHDNDIVKSNTYQYNKTVDFSCMPCIWLLAVVYAARRVHPSSETKLKLITIDRLTTLIVNTMFRYK